MARAIARATAAGAYSLIDGGDPAVTVRQMGFGEQMSCIGGSCGTLLEHIAGKELPGVAALRQEQLLHAKESRLLARPGLFGVYRISGRARNRA